MKIELMARWTRIKEDKRSVKERKEEQRLKRVIGKDDDYFDGEEEFNELAYFAYDPLTIDTKDIIAWNKFDNEHTTIRTTLGEGINFIIKTPYEIFCTFWEFMTKETTTKPEQFQFQIGISPHE